MAKIVLKHIYLVNWYGFIDQKIPMGQDLTLITGENECGKSTILDAVKYAFTGDTEFNKSTNAGNVGGDKRTLHSYTRCLVDPSSGVYARPADKLPNVYSHISLEYYDEINNNSFILGVILETNVNNNVSPYWYVMEHKSMDEISYVYEDSGLKKPYDYQKFQKHYGVQIMTRKEAMPKFMNMTGLKLSFNEVNRFQRKLRSIMTYNPAAKIQQFIKDSVLEAHNVNFDKLRDAKNNIDKINTTLELIKQEVNMLDGILNDFENYARVSFRLFVDDAKQLYRDIRRLEDSITATQKQIEQNRIETQYLSGEIDQMEMEKDQVEGDYLRARGDLLEMDCSKAIEAEKKDETLRLESFMSETKDRAIECKRDIQKRLEETQKELIHYRQVLEDCDKNRPDYSYVQEQQALIREINREFDSKHIISRARFSCEFVVKLEDEEWRNAIEAFLGIHRYSIIVEPEYFDIANAVMDRSSHRYVELVNTKLLEGKHICCEEDAVAKKLVIRNEIARKYFDYWLGGIHAVSMVQVPDYENAMSKEGKLSRNMSVTFINMKKLKTYCLGQEAIELNRKAAQNRLKELEREEKEILTEQKQNQDFVNKMVQMLGRFRDYNFDADQEHGKVQKKWEESGENLNKLLEAQENNSEYLALDARVRELEKQIKTIKGVLEDKGRRRNELEVDIEKKQFTLNRNSQLRQEKEEKLQELRLLHPSESKTAIKEYDDFLMGNTKTGDVMLADSRRKREGEKSALANSIVGGQKTYNIKKPQEERLPEGLEYEGKYLARKNKIWVDDLQAINVKMAEQTRKYETIFKNEFVLSIYQTALTAKQDVAGINKELRKLQFSTKYQFDVNLLDDMSDFAKVLRYAEYIKKTNKVDDGQIVFGNLYGYEEDEIEQREKEIRELINRIVEKNDESMIQEFADYRNYMSYEIIINNADVKDGRLSKQAGYNSGAGTQIPYTLILSAALSMLYNARMNSTRLIFIDEPFEKMSDHNIKLMLEFFKNQDFQVIFCAPPNKTDSIGYECDVIIPVLKERNDNMQIGSVQFHDR
ncbi:MAG: AAA family ATPase [Muribaculaceae bacterium]|nr:AAA family ATPase [Muribaculaceae bacterium]